MDKQDEYEELIRQAEVHVDLGEKSALEPLRQYTEERDIIVHQLDSMFKKLEQAEAKLPPLRKR